MAKSIFKTSYPVVFAFILSLLLVPFAHDASAHDLGGTWGSAQYKVELNVSGTTVKGSFSSLWHPEEPSGSIAGEWKEGTFIADWQMPEGKGSGDFTSVLNLSPDGETLSGYIWTEGFYSTSFALHKEVDGQVAVIFDEEILIDQPSSEETIAGTDTHADPSLNFDRHIADMREHTRHGRLDNALASARAALEIKPDHEETINNLQRIERLKSMVDQNLAQIQDMIDSGEYERAREALNSLSNAYSGYPPLQEMEARLARSEAKHRTADKAAQTRTLAALERAEALWNKGNYDAAVILAEEAAAVDKDLAAPVLQKFSRDLKTMGWDALIVADHQTAINRLQQAVRLNPADQDARTKLDQARDYAAKWPLVETKIKEFDALMAQKNIWSAHRVLIEAQDILITMARGQSANNPYMKRVRSDFDQGVQEYNKFIAEKKERHTVYFKQENFEAMLRNAESMFEWELSPGDEANARSVIDFASHYLKANEYGQEASKLISDGSYEKALEAILKGRDIHPKSVEFAIEKFVSRVNPLAREAELMRDFDTSGELYSMVVKIRPENDEARVGAGNASNYKRYSDEVRGWHVETQAHMRRGDWDKSEDLLRTILRWEEQIPGEMFVETKSLLEQQEKGYAEYKAYAARYKKESSALMKRKCLDMARVKIMEMRKRHLIASDEDWAQTWLEHIDKIQKDCDAGIIEYGNRCGRDCPDEDLVIVQDVVHPPEDRLTPPETVHLGDIRGVLDQDNRDARHPVTITRPGGLKVSVQAEETLKIHLDLYDVNATRHLAGDSGGVSISSRKVERAGLAPGTYYIHVRRAQGHGSYTVKPQLEAVTIAGDKEPNDTREQAQEITLGSTLTGLLGYGNVEGTDTQDWFKVATTRPGGLKVSVQAEETLKIHLDLYDVNATRHLAGDSGGVSISSRKVERAGLAPGTYYIHVRRAQGHGSYTIKPQLEAVTIAGDKEPNDTREQAQVIPMGQEFTGLLGYGNVEGTDTQDWFKVTTTRPGTLSVKVQAEETLKIHLDLYDVNATRHLAGDSGGVSISSRKVERAGLAPGTYFIHVRRAQGHGSYTVKPQLEAVTIGDMPQGIRIQTRKSIYRPNESIEVLYSRLPGNIQDWITITRQDLSDQNYGEWFYTRGNTDGTFNFRGLPEGVYEVRLYYNWPDGGFVVQDRHGFQVISVSE